MKTFKTVITMFLSITLIIALIACGDVQNNQFDKSDFENRLISYQYQIEKLLKKESIPYDKLKMLNDTKPIKEMFGKKYNYVIYSYYNEREKSYYLNAAKVGWRNEEPIIKYRYEYFSRFKSEDMPVFYVEKCYGAHSKGQQGNILDFSYGKVFDDKVSKIVIKYDKNMEVLDVEKLYNKTFVIDKKGEYMIEALDKNGNSLGVIN
ncbi:MAG: hypothetical protein RR063_07350 [Anaerovoracaceae bacterium]